MHGFHLVPLPFLRSGNILEKGKAFIAKLKTRTEEKIEMKWEGKEYKNKKMENVKGKHEEKAKRIKIEMTNLNL